MPPGASGSFASETPPAQIGGYRIDRRLGRGGMATVYLARDAAGKPVALKLTQPQYAEDPTFRQRFVREIEATRSLRNPHVVQLVSAGEHDGLPYMACEFVDGGSLEGLLDESPRLAAPLSLELAAQLLEGLAHAHSQGIIHRDLKPANLLLTSGGVLKIADFGVAKVRGATQLTRTGALFGTPAYMSPEQAQGLVVDVRSDLFAVGVILYQLLSGKNPHRAEDPSVTLMRVQMGAPPIVEIEPTVLPEVEALVEQLLERDPDKRPATAAQALAQILPLVEDHRRREPRLMATAVLDPAGTGRRLRAEQAELCRSRARALLADSQFLPAAVWLRRATLLDPGNSAAARLFTQVCEREKLTFAPSTDAKTLELLERVARQPDDKAALLELATRHREAGDLFSAMAALKRCLRLTPGDPELTARLLQITGDKPGPRAAGSVVTAGVDAAGLRAPRATPPLSPAVPAAPVVVPVARPAAPGPLAATNPAAPGAVAVASPAASGAVAVASPAAPFAGAAASSGSSAPTQPPDVPSAPPPTAQHPEPARQPGAGSGAGAETETDPAIAMPAGPQSGSAAARTAAPSPAASSSPIGKAAGATAAPSPAAAARAPLPAAPAARLARPSRLWIGERSRSEGGRRKLLAGAAVVALAAVGGSVVALRRNSTAPAQASGVDPALLLEPGSAGLTPAQQQALLEENARDASQRLASANAAFRSGDYSMTILAADALLAHFPRRPEAGEATWLRARALLALDRDGEALEALARFTDANRKSPHYPEALLRSGEAFLRLGDAASALVPLDQLVTQFPDGPLALEALLRRGQARAARGDGPGAQADYRQLLSRGGVPLSLELQAKEALAQLQR